MRIPSIHYINELCSYLPAESNGRFMMTTHITIPLSQARPPSGLQLPLTLKWRRCRDMPCVMEDLQSVRVGEDVFVGGGRTHSLSFIGYGDDDEHTVYQYHPPTDQWVPLPQYDYAYFAMAILTNKLTLVGGYNTSTRKATNQITVWDTEGISQGWTHPYPSMPTPRYSPAVATHDKRLVVAGGSKFDDLLATVEVLDTTSHQWLSTSPLPMKCANMTVAVANKELYLLGGGGGGDTHHGDTCCPPPRHNTEQCSLHHHEHVRRMAYPLRTSTGEICSHLCV